MPKAFGQKYHYRHYDADYVDPSPPVLNQWYTVFDAEDVRLLWCYFYQSNDEVANKNIEVRWTIDGVVFLRSFNRASDTVYHVYRTPDPQGYWGTGIESVVTEVNAGKYTDVRGRAFKVEIRITSALGTNQALFCTCVRETLELT